jgi:hypothetical protein
VVVVAAIATLWVVAAGNPTARILRGVFAAASPLALVVAVAALLAIGLALRVVPSVSRPRILAGDGRLRDRRLLAAAGRVPVVVWLSTIVALAAVIRTVLNEASQTPKILCATSWSTPASPRAGAGRECPCCAAASTSGIAPSTRCCSRPCSGSRPTERARSPSRGR